MFFGTKKNKYFFILFSFAYAYFVAFFPWDDFRSRGFADLEVYINNFEKEVYSADTEGLSILNLFSGEILWRILIYSLIDRFGDAELVFQLITFFISFIFSYAVLLMAQSAWAFVFLFNPILLDLELSQIRSGLGMAFIYIAFSFRHLGIRLPLVGGTLFVHSAMLVMSCAFAFCEYIQKLAQRNYRRAVLTFVLGLLGLVVLMGLRGILLSEMGDRRADLQAPASGLLFTILWLIVAFPLIKNLRLLVTRVNWMYAVLFLILFGFLSLAGAYGSRYVALAYPMIISSVFGLSIPSRRYFLGYLLLFQCAHLWLWW